MDSPTMPPEYDSSTYDLREFHFEETRFMEPHKTTTAELRLSTLSSSGYHPVFNPNRFIGFTPEDLMNMDQSLLLASKILESDVLTPFFHIIKYHKPAERWHHNEKNEKRFDLKQGWRYNLDSIDPRRIIPAAELQSTRESLVVLSTQVTYLVERAESEDPNAKTSQETDNPVYESMDISGDTVEKEEKKKEITEGAVTNVNDAVNDWTTSHGCQSFIRVSETTLKNLADAVASPADVPWLMSMQFHLAVMLVHEVTHAYRWWLEGWDIRTEPFFGHQPVAELGFELEAFLFDGHIQLSWKDLDMEGTEDNSWYIHRHNDTQSKLRGAWILWDWPYQLVREEYRVVHNKNENEETPSENKEDPDEETPNEEVETSTEREAEQAPEEEKDEGMMPTRWEPCWNQALDRGWRINIKFFQKFFTDAFWTDLANAPPADRLGHFQPDRETGFCFRVPLGEANPIPVLTSTEENKYLPSSYYRRLKKTGDIVLRTRGTKLRDVRYKMYVAMVNAGENPSAESKFRMHWNRDPHPCGDDEEKVPTMSPQPRSPSKQKKRQAEDDERSDGKIKRSKASEE